MLLGVTSHRKCQIEVRIFMDDIRPQKSNNFRTKISRLTENEAFGTVFKY